MNNNKFLSMLGLCQRAGKMVSGEFSCEGAVKNHKAKLVIIADDASDNTKKKFSDMCSFYKTNLIYYGSKSLLGKSIGKEYRSSLAVVDAGFADAIVKLTDTDVKD